MKYVLLAIILVGCTVEGGSRNPKPSIELPAGVNKFQDKGGITCYTYYDQSISCMVTVEEPIENP